MAVVYTVN